MIRDPAREGLPIRRGDLLLPRRSDLLRSYDGRFRPVLFQRREDLKSLILPAPDVTALRECRPGDCDVKLPAVAMHRFRNDVDWLSPNAARKGDEVAREMILALVRV
jgi:hypothetical protein